MRNQSIVLIMILAAISVFASSAVADLTLLEQSRKNGIKANLIWFDATANLERLSSREKVAKILDKCVDSGINGVAVGVKSSCGFALYNSDIAPRMGNFVDRFDYPKEYDLLQTTIEEGHKRGLRVYAMLMVFAEGRLSDKSGPAYTKFPEWQTVIYDIASDGKPALIRSEESRSGVFVFVNPVISSVQQYELSIIEEVARKYQVDGIVIDRCRYDGIRSDFSEESRKAFEEYIGDRVGRWPEDVYVLKGGKGTLSADPNLPAPAGWSIVPGPYITKWVEWRAQVIGDFVRNASDTVTKTRPVAAFGAVVGAWYPEYVPEGANWASRSYTMNKARWWYTQKYRQAGFAESLDFLVPNCYGSIVMAKSGVTPWWTVEGGAATALSAVNDACHVYAGIYVKEYQNKPENFKKALEMAVSRTGGVKIFDLSQVEEYNWWIIIKQVLKRSAEMPHESIKSKRHKSET